MGVCIIGWAHTPFGRLDDMDLEALIATVSRDALADAALDAADVDGIWLGSIKICSKPFLISSDSSFETIPICSSMAACAREP